MLASGTFYFLPTLSNSSQGSITYVSLIYLNSLIDLRISKHPGDWYASLYIKLYIYGVMYKHITIYRNSINNHYAKQYK